MSNPLISLDADWQAAHLWQPPASLTPWLLEAESLTARLRQYCTRFRVQVLQEQRQAVPGFLQHLLPDTTAAHVREVILWCDAQPCVYAQSWLPLQSIEVLKPLADLGERPLGEFIFQYAGLHRSTIEIAQLPVLLPDVGLQLTCWGRRSVFTVERQPLLVAEIFLPAMAVLEKTS